MATKNAADSPPIEVLFALHPKFDMLDFSGPLAAFSAARHDFSDESEYCSSH